MKGAKSFSLAAGLVMVLATPALCQETRGSQSGLERGYLTAVGGTALAEEITPMLAVEYGDTLHRNLQAYATFSYFDNLMNEGARARLDQLGQLLTVASGAPWEFVGRDRAFAFSAGAKFLVPTGGAVRPYVGGGVGIMNLARTIAERTRGDITEVFLEGFTLADGVFDSGTINETSPFGEASVGAVFLGARAYVDVGYRYRSVFHMSDGLRFGQFGVGVGMKF